MRCYECGNPYVEHEGALELNSNIIGTYTIYLEKYHKCSGCGNLMFSKEAVEKIEAIETEILEKMISRLPVGDFISANEAAEFLGITRQAFHKHRRIKSGLIYSIEIGGKKLYNKKSLSIFKKTNDGRFFLAEQQYKEAAKYIEVQNSGQIRTPYTNEIKNYPISYEIKENRTSYFRKLSTIN